MKLLIKTALIAASMIVLNGCFYTNIRVPLDTDADNTQLGSKTGQAYMQSAVWLFAWGDASTRAAAQNGGLTTVTHLDLEQLIVFFGIYSKTTTIAYGE